MRIETQTVNDCLIPYYVGDQWGQNVNPEDFESLKKTAAVFNHHGGRRKNPKGNTDDRWFCNQYAARRRRFSPDFELSRTARRRLIHARRRLVKHQYFHRGAWSRYLDHCFEAFPRITKGALDFAPVQNVDSDHLFERFHGSAGTRKAWYPGVKAALVRGGFELGVEVDKDQVHPKAICWLVTDIKTKPRQYKVETINPPIYRQAVQYVLDHWDQVGWA